jgi:hypothetical protein
VKPAKLIVAEPAKIVDALQSADYADERRLKTRPLFSRRYVPHFQGSLTDRLKKPMSQTSAFNLRNLRITHILYPQITQMSAD